MIDVIFHPSELPANAAGAQIVVLDVLRATSTIVTALAVGAREVRLFDALDAARAAKSAWKDPAPALLAGEEKCLKPAGFDLGNSPREFTPDKVQNAAILLATTNGTRAAVAAQRAGAHRLFVGSLLNASATAQALLPDLTSRDSLLLCAGTNGAFSQEDALGAGAILFAVLQATYRPDLDFSDRAWLAYHAFTAVRHRLPAALHLGKGGVNVILANLEPDIDHCARLNAVPLVATIDAVGGQLVARQSS
jgi:2-phosphosulfolactate phosphatase